MRRRNLIHSFKPTALSLAFINICRYISGYVLCRTADKFRPQATQGAGTVGSSPDITLAPPRIALHSPDISAATPSIATGTTDIAAISPDITAGTTDIAPVSPAIAALSPPIAVVSPDMTPASPPIAAVSPVIDMVSPVIASIRGRIKAVAGERRPATVARLTVSSNL